MEKIFSELAQKEADNELQEALVLIETLKLRRDQCNLELRALGKPEFPLYVVDVAARIASYVSCGPRTFKWLRKRVRRWCMIDGKNVLHFDKYFELAIALFETEDDFVYSSPYVKVKEIG